MKHLLKNINSVWVIRRAFALIMFFIFVELYHNVPLLIGEKGLVPFKQQMLHHLSENGLWFSLVNFPTLFWMNQSDGIIQFTAIVGAFVSLLIFISVEWFVFDLMVWIIYGSFLQCLALFTDINDYVVMECVFLFIFFFPWKLKPTWNADKRPLRAAVLGFYFFIFKLTLGMLLFKLLSSSPHWTNLTFVKYFYPNSPIPAPLSYFMYQLPMEFHKFSTLMVFILQFLTCLFVFAPKKFRKIAFYSILFLQAPILFVTNLGATNILMILVSFFLFLDLDKLEKIDFKKNVYAWVIGVYVLFASTLLLTHFRQGEANHLSKRYLFYKSPAESVSLIEKSEIYLFRYKIEYILARFYDIYTDQRDLAFAYSSDGKNFHESSLKYSLSDEKTAPPFLWTLSFSRLRIPLFYYLKGTPLPVWRSSFYYKFPWYKELISKSYKEFDYFNEHFLEKKPVCQSECRYFKLRLYRYNYSTIPELFESGKWWNRTLIAESKMIDLKAIPEEFPEDLVP